MQSKQLDFLIMPTEASEEKAFHQSSRIPVSSGAPVQFEGGALGKEDSGMNLSWADEFHLLGGLVEIINAFIWLF